MTREAGQLWKLQLADTFVEEGRLQDHCFDSCTNFPVHNCFGCRLCLSSDNQVSAHSWQNSQPSLRYVQGHNKLRAASGQYMICWGSWLVSLEELLAERSSFHWLSFVNPTRAESSLIASLRQLNFLATLESSYLLLEDQTGPSWRGCGPVCEGTGAVFPHKQDESVKLIYSLEWSDLKCFESACFHSGASTSWSHLIWLVCHISEGNCEHRKIAAKDLIKCLMSKCSLFEHHIWSINLL